MDEVDDQYVPSEVEPSVEAYWDDADAYDVHIVRRT